MEKKKMALCTPIPEDKLSFIRECCDVTICGELKHGKGHVTEEMTREECMGNELVVLGDEYAGADTIKAWADAGMKFLGVAKGTPWITVRSRTRTFSFPTRRGATVWQSLSLPSA